MTECLRARATAPALPLCAPSWNGVVLSFGDQIDPNALELHSGAARVARVCGPTAGLHKRLALLRP